MSIFNRNWLMALLLPLGLGACQPPSQENQAAQESQPPQESQAEQAPATEPDNSANQAPDTASAADTAPMGDNSRNSLDWGGSYEGTLPCDGCDGIKTRLTLNADGSYVLQSERLGDPDAKMEESSGKLQWNDAGSAVQLEDGSWYQVGEGQLFMLDSEGNRHTGDDAADYRLGKVQ